MSKVSQCAVHHALILEMNDQGYERWEIAEKIGVTKTMLQAYLQRRKISPPFGRARSLLRHEEEIRNLIEVQRLTHAQIAERFGVDASTIERICGRLAMRTSRTGPRGAEAHIQRWRGGRFLEKYWYVSVFVPMHPNAKVNGYVGEHRLVLEAMLGRYLTRSEVVDHIDSHTQHNWPSNIRLFQKNAEHLRQTLAGLYGESKIRAIFGKWTNERRNDPVPSADETLAGCSDDDRRKIDRHIEIHRPTSNHAHLARRELWRIGAWAPPFQ